MTGIVGFTFSGDPAAADSELSAMLAAVTDHPSYCVDRWLGDGVALGRVSLGRVDKQPQPIWNEDNTRCIVFEGELYGFAALRAQLERQGRQFRAGNAAELVLQLWEDRGDEGLKLLNGGFTFAIWNTVDRSLVVGNDRFGFRHVYYAVLGNEIAFACGVRGLLANTQLPRKTDAAAIAQALHFEYVLGDRTYVAGVKLLPPAAVLHMRAGHCARHRYWYWSMPEFYEPHSRQEYQDELLRLFKQAVARQLPAGGLRGGINLSGGLDSRMLLGVLAAQMDVRELHAYTFGITGCDDIRIAREIARRVGAPHRALPLPADYLQTYAEMGVRLTDGMDSCVHIHSVANVEAQAQEVDFLYTGYYVDATTYTDGTREWLVRFDDETALRLHYRHMHRLFPHEPDESIYTPEFRRAAQEEFKSAFRQAVMEVKGDSMSSWVEGVEIVHRQRRLTQFGNELVRWQVECRTPFTDTDVVDFCLALPPGLRMDRILFTETLVAHFPQLAKAPSDRTGMPYVVDARYLWRQARHNARYWLYQRGLAPEPQHRPKPYVRYDLWFRTVLRPWVEQVLLDARTLQRGILQPAAVQRMVREHMSGEVDRTREIGMLFSIELWHRAYID